MRLREENIRLGLEKDITPIELSEIFEEDEEVEDPLYEWVRDRGEPVLDEPEGRPNSQIAFQLRVDVDDFMASEGNIHSQTRRPFEDDISDDTTRSPTPTQTQTQTRTQTSDDDDSDIGGSSDGGDGGAGGDGGTGGSRSATLREIEHDMETQPEPQPDPIRFTGESLYPGSTQDEDHGARIGR